MNEKLECHFCNCTITGGNYGLVEDTKELELYMACRNCFDKLKKEKSKRRKALYENIESEFTAEDVFFIMDVIVLIDSKLNRPLTFEEVSFITWLMKTLDRDSRKLLINLFEDIGEEMCKNT